MSLKDSFIPPPRLLRFLSTSFFFVCIFTLFICQNAQAKTVDPSIFLGPPLGETIILDGCDGTVTKRTTTAVSDTGVYSIEERTRLPVKEIKEGLFKGRNARIMRGEEDIVDNYTLQAVEGKIVITRCNEAETVVDLLNRKWTHRGDDLSGNYFEIQCSLVGEKEKLIHGKKRKVIYVETFCNAGGYAVKSVYTVASGLGIIHYEVVDPDDPLVLFTLKEN
ncbi:hypothetical protein SAMN05660337_0374 [Maridesulfovibrio ferrireducens]|uniref:Uncharacterized protein n=1 Tax=Maridesulfovibrio ferrireducens TaxID=246191 RepID=A0A1G9BPH0_9BACT|nr:hypothetical protein [Maridesulfovibrio ferrireducens]SDK41398.1 hypothetical protein SAMN05660337_0374 [Maridesulfovibrio ferrireducens]